MKARLATFVVFYLTSAWLSVGCIDFAGTGMEPEKYCQQTHIQAEGCNDVASPSDALLKDVEDVSTEKDTFSSLPDLYEDEQVVKLPDTLLEPDSALTEDVSSDVVDEDVVTQPDWITHTGGGAPDQLKGLEALENVSMKTVEGQSCTFLETQQVTLKVVLPGIDHPHFRVRVQMARMESAASGSFRPVWSPQAATGLQVRQTEKKHLVSSELAGVSTALYDATHAVEKKVYTDYVWEIERNSNEQTNYVKFWIDPPKSDGAEWDPPNWQGNVDDSIVAGAFIQLKGLNTCWRKLYVEYPTELVSYCGDGKKDEGEDCENCAQDLGAYCENCGDNKQDMGETCDTCPGDMPPGECDSPELCGNGVPDPGETCDNCPEDMAVPEECDGQTVLVGDCIPLVDSAAEECWLIANNAVFDSSNKESSWGVWFTPTPDVVDPPVQYTIEGQASGECISLNQDPATLTFTLNNGVTHPLYRGLFWKNSIFRQPKQRGQALFKVPNDVGDDAVEKPIAVVHILPDFEWPFFEGGESQVKPVGGHAFTLKKGDSGFELEAGGTSHVVDVKAGKWHILDWEIDTKQGASGKLRVWLTLMGKGPNDAEADAADDTVLWGPEIYDIVGSTTPWIFFRGQACLNSLHLFGLQGQCGNGVKEAEEGCDDGNSQSWDGCSESCEKEETTLNSCNGAALGLTWIDPDGSGADLSANGLNPLQVKCEEDGWIEIAKNDGGTLLDGDKFVSEHYQHGWKQADKSSYAIPCDVVERIVANYGVEKSDFVVRLEIQGPAYDAPDSYLQVEYMRALNKGMGFCEMITKSNGVNYQWWGKIEKNNQQDPAWHVPPAEDDGTLGMQFFTYGIQNDMLRALGGSKVVDGDWEGQEAPWNYKSMDPERIRLPLWGNAWAPGALAFGACPGATGDDIAPHISALRLPFRLSIKPKEWGKDPISMEEWMGHCVDVED